MTAVEPVDRNGVQVVHRTAAILRALRDEANGLTLSQIADRVGLARSTVYRLVSALEQEKFVVAATRTRGFRLGPGLASLTIAATRDLTSLVHPFLAELAAELNETVDLAVLEQDAVLFIDRVAARAQGLLVLSHVGGLLPAHCTANGKVLLSALTDDEIKAILPARLPRLTPQTTTSRAKLLVELHEVRRKGIAVVREEHTPGVCAVGMGIGGESGTVASISVPVPAQRFEAAEKGIEAALRRRRSALDALFGA